MSRYVKGQQTDSTLEAWARCATALGPVNSIEILAAVAKAAIAISASDDVKGEALPHVFKAVWDNGLSPAHAANMCVRSLHYGAQAKATDPSFVSLDATETSADRDALEAAIHAAGLGRDDVARCYGGGSRGEILSLTEALEVAPNGPAAIIRALIVDGLTVKVPNATVQTYTGNGADTAVIMVGTAAYFKPADDAAMALHGGVKKRHAKVNTYRPLKVSIIALAAGVDRPRTAQASDVLRRAGCHAHAVVQALRDPSQTVEELEAAAYAYVTRDRRAYGGHGQAVWQHDARPALASYAVAEVRDSHDNIIIKARDAIELPYDLYRPLSEFQPDIHNGSHVAPLQPARGTRVNTGTKGKKGPACGQPSPLNACGSGNVRTPGSIRTAMPADDATRELPKLDRGPNDAGLTAKRSLRADKTALDLHESSDARAQAKACTRAIASPDNVYLSALWAPRVATCGCGPTNGQTLITHTVKRVDIVRNSGGQRVEVETTVNYYTHALSVCPVPTTGTRGTSCGCGRKRGALTAQGEHRAR